MVRLPLQNVSFWEGSDSARVGAFVRLERPAWTVLASAAVAEFAGPMSRARTTTLLLVLAGTGAITAGCVLLLRRYTDSLVQLTTPITSLLNQHLLRLIQIPSI